MASGQFKTEATGTETANTPCGHVTTGAAGSDHTDSFDARLSRGHRVMLGLILLLGLALRLYHINAPPVDFLAWRDTQTLMVARNFYRHGMNIFTPEVDWRTTTRPPVDGLVGGTELQVVPFLTAALYHVFGVAYWAGRVVPIAFALLGICFFHRLVRRFYGPTCAAIAALLLTVSPYYLYCGRCQMPETFVFAMSFATLLYFDKWLESRRSCHYWLAAACCLLMLLGKPHMIVMAIPMAFLSIRRFRKTTFSEPSLYCFAALVGAPVLLYMAYSYRAIIPRTGLSFAQPELMNHRLLLDPKYYTRIAGAVWQLGLTPLVCVLGGLGLFVLPRNGRGWLAHAWLLGALAFFFLVPGGNRVNGYYQLMLAPPAAILAGRVLALCYGETLRRMRMPGAGAVRGAATVLMLLTSLLLAATAWRSGSKAMQLCRPFNASSYHCGMWLRDNTPDDALVLTSTSNPITLYFADRAGWICWREDYGKPITFSHDLINTVGNLGATVLAIPLRRFDNGFHPEYAGIRDDLYDSYQCYHGEDFAVFSLGQPADLSLPEGKALVFGPPDSRKYLRGYWGLQQRGADGSVLVPMGPANRSSIVFTSSGPVGRIRLTIASPVPNQRITVTVNNEEIGTLSGAGPWLPAKIDIPTVPPPLDGRYTVTLEVDRQDERHVSLLLYNLLLGEETPAESQAET